MTSMDSLAATFSALGTGVRLRILQLLLQSEQGLSVGAIKAKVRIPGSTLSFHLDRLKRHELVTVEREGATLRYVANPKALSRMADFFPSDRLPRRVAPQRSVVKAAVPISEPSRAQLRS